MIAGRVVGRDRPSREHHERRERDERDHDAAFVRAPSPVFAVP